MCENMVVSDGHYTESGNCSVSDKEKERHALTIHVSYLQKWRRAPDMHVSHSKQRETRYIGVRLPFT
jgi:hypothetical protein